MPNHIEKLTANQTPAQAVERVRVDEDMRALAKRIREEGGARDSERIKEALRLVEQSYSLTKEADPKEKFRTYIEAIQDQFFGIDEPYVCLPPKPEEINDAWFEKMFPNVDKDHQRDEDVKAGRLNFRPHICNIDLSVARKEYAVIEWFKKKLKKNYKPKDCLVKTFMDDFVRAMKNEVTEMSDWEMVYSELAMPIEQDDKRRGLVIDPINDYINEAFGENKTRYFLGVDDVRLTLVQKIEDELIKKWKEQGLKIPPFRVMCTPAVITRQIMEDKPELSQSIYRILTSTKIENEKAYLTIGGFIGYEEDKDQENGGAGSVWYKTMDDKHAEFFRLSIVFYKEKEAHDFIKDAVIQIDKILITMRKRLAHTARMNTMLGSVISANTKFYEMEHLINELEDRKRDFTKNREI